MGDDEHMQATRTYNSKVSLRRLSRLQTRFEENLRNVSRNNWNTDHVTLRRATLFLLQIQQFQLFDLESISACIPEEEQVAWRQNLERGISEGWSSAKALRLHISKIDEECVLKTLVKLRCNLSSIEQKPTAADKPKNEIPNNANKTTKEGMSKSKKKRNYSESFQLAQSKENQLEKINDRVSLVITRAKRLQQKLEEIGEKPVDDEHVALTKYLLMAIRSAKIYLKGTYVHIPWEEMEFLLTAFFESQTRLDTWSFLVATTARTRTYLKMFIARLDTLKEEYRRENIKELPNLPNLSRALFISTGVKKVWRQLYEDCAMLRDLQSLLAIEQVLGTAVEILDQDEQWKKYGPLVLRRALCVAGEKMKNTWDSPNLSERYQEAIIHLAPNGINSILKSIRDGFAHGKHYSLKDMNEEQRKIMKEELRSVKGATSVLIIDAEWELLLKFFERRKMTENDISRVHLCCFEFKDTKEEIPIYAEITNGISKIMQERGGSFQLFQLYVTLKKDIEDLKNLQIAYVERRKKYISGSAKEKSAGLTYYSRHVEFHRLLRSAVSDLPPGQGAIEITSLYLSHCRSDILTELQMTSDYKIQSASQRESLNCAVKLLKILPQSRTCGSDTKESLIIDGSLQIVGCSWFPNVSANCAAYQTPTVMDHSITDLFWPVLYGKRLRNFLNHGDRFIDVCFTPRSELRAVAMALTNTLEHVILPPCRPEKDSYDENERLLKLIRLKCDMFSFAEKGDMENVYFAMEKGADPLSRNGHLDSLLHVAAERGHSDLLRGLLCLRDVGKDLTEDSVDWHGRSALHVASNVDVAEQLVNAGFSVNSKDHFGRTPMHIAASRGWLSVVEFYLEQEAEHWAEDNSRNTPLDLAAAAGHVVVMLVLIKVAAGSKRCVRIKTSLLSATVESGNVLAVQTLFSDQVGLRGLVSRNSLLEACQIAAETGQHEVFRFLIKNFRNRPDQKVRWVELMEVVQSVVEGGYRSIMDIFLADFCSKQEAEELIKSSFIDGDLNLLQVAAKSGSYEVVQCLIDKGADPLHNYNTDKTALHLAAGWGFPKTVAILLGKIPDGHPLRTGRDLIMPPLCLAAHKGHAAVVELLIKNGADINIPPQWDTKTSVVHFAADFGHLEVLEILLKHGALPSNLELNKVTPLHQAAFNGHLSVVKRLLPPLPKKLEDREKFDRGECRRRLDVLQCLDDNNGSSLLGFGMVSRSFPIVKYVLEQEWGLLELDVNDKNAGKRNVSVYQKNAIGQTCLDTTATFGHTKKIVELILNMMLDRVMMARAGMNMESVFNMIQTAYMMAMIESGSLDLKQLVGHKVHPAFATGPADFKHKRAQIEVAQTLKERIEKLRRDNAGKKWCKERDIRQVFLKHARANGMQVQRAIAQRLDRIKSAAETGNTLTGTLWARYCSTWYNNIIDMDPRYIHYCL